MIGSCEKGHRWFFEEADLPDQIQQGCAQCRREAEEQWLRSQELAHLLAEAIRPIIREEIIKLLKELQ